MVEYGESDKVFWEVVMCEKIIFVKNAYETWYDDKTGLVQFNDYDPVDVHCLSMPDFIKNQPVEIAKCGEEE